MEIIISNSIVGILIILAYTLGLNKGKTSINIPSIAKVIKNPVKTIKNSIQYNKREQEELEEARKLAIAINNIENYNGDYLGQEEVE